MTRPPLNLVSAPFRGYWTGITPTQQIILGFLYPSLVCASFDKFGFLLDVEELPLPPESKREWSEFPVDPRRNNAPLRPISFAELEKCKNRLGFVEGLIKLFPFDLRPQFPVMLDYTPSYIKYVAANPDEFDEEEVAECVDTINNWEDWFDHEFIWAKDYLINPDGTISSS